MNAKKAFTLIELLVVIAIIAILAAILFPVFAQAKAAAKRTASLSNEKQLSLGVIIYQGDADDTFPSGTSAWMCFINGCGSEYWGQLQWGPAIAPYLKANGLYGSPEDSLGGKKVPDPNGWMGLTTSYSPNGLTSGGGCKGVMCMLFPGESVVSATSVNKPADVIMFAESHSDQLVGAGLDPNRSAFFNGIFTGWYYYINRQLPNQCGTSDFGHPTCDKFPWSTTGAVSVKSGKTSNFVFCDGHAKALNPVATVPNPASAATGAPWWLFGEYDDGKTSGKPSMWMASHE